MDENENEMQFMSMYAAMLNNWDVRIRLYENSQQFLVSTHLSEFSECSIEDEYVEATSTLTGFQTQWEMGLI